MIKKITITCMLCILLTLAGCVPQKTNKKENFQAQPTHSPQATFNPQELTDTANWKKVESNSRFFRFSIKVPQSARYYFSPDTVMGTENGVYIGEDYFPKGLNIHYNALNDRDARTVTFKTDYQNAVPSDIDFGLQNAVMTRGKDTRGMPYERYLVRKDDNLYIFSIQTDNQLYIKAYKEILKTVKIEK